ncbi:Alcohol dehydrogenase [Candidatus Rhodobacter oscarellae]|uniref:Alcohol dehydrogenase n=2 Tax=Candidatus Rhodobacter oscarellae TaxID=1675527 RepID=A0A0J9ECC7_9RHOB|nr:Alcohol dehydrogenase [Candidatus Rhodobacter lobularis]
MQATRLLRTGDIRTVEAPVPQPGPGELLIKVEAAGICGTDRHLFKGEFPSVPGKILGHEFSGIIVDAGDTGMDLGARVTCDPNTWCGACAQCLRGRVNLCQNNIATGIHRDGGFAEYCAFPAAKAVVLPAGLDPLHGAFCEPLACTLHGMDIGAAQAGERVLVIGGGVIGLMAVQIARLAGAEVGLLTHSAAKQGLGRELGADHAVGDAQLVREIWPDGADLVVECAGVAATVAQAPSLARTGGRVVVLGVLPQGEQVPIEPFDLLFREVQMHFSFLNPFTHARAAAMIANGSIIVAPLVSRSIPLDQAAAAIASPPPKGEVRAIVVPR